MEIIFTALGLILAWFVYRLAKRQKKVSEVQLRRDSYDRNYRIYSAAEKFIYKIKSGWILNSDFELKTKKKQENKYNLIQFVSTSIDHADTAVPSIVWRGGALQTPSLRYCTSWWSR